MTMLSMFTPRVTLLRLYTQPRRLFSTAPFLFKEAVKATSTKKVITPSKKASSTTTKKASAKKASAKTASSKKASTAGAKKSAKAKKAAADKKAAALKLKKENSITELKKKEKPKRPSSSFALFYKDHFNDFYVKGEPVTNAVSKASKAWAETSDEIKSQYNEKVNANYIDYNKLKDEWIAKYKRPLTGYTKFIKSNIDKSTCKTTSDAINQMKQLAAKWSALTIDEKESWKAKQL
ncbi:hypothetical protein C6P40_003275 [Pichia californica]|uniref:HMG box domain-containing protein n=1 Tax=Pichia californica TaxID=460514 RepID=A0A9P7BF01_9ASCO|nr:hypothetical protein C6P42_004107 [[Candida] californica]KAG0686853.1 hypothetical protein C6P40_003275 [[Candida] californica]